MSDLLEGVMLSEYLLLHCISKGGIADVYRARQIEGRNYEVAIKVFRTGYAQRESFREYFMTEAEKIGKFEHPNILPFLEFGEGEDLLYSVTPFVTSGTLEDLLRRVGGKLNAMQALQIMQQLCSAVQYAHDRDVIHGNIKPTNIFVAADSRMLLSDFGIMRGYDDSQQSLTRVGWGSAEYAAPEQSLGVLRRASDIYSLGVLLFRILTGEPPFTGQTPVEVLLKHVREQAPLARSFDPNISDAVDGVLHMALQKRSDDRFASVEEFVNALTVAISVAPVASPVARSVTPKSHQLIPEQLTVVSDPQTPLPSYMAQSSSLSPITPAISIGQHYTSSDFVEPSINQTATFGKIPVVKEDSDITLARRTNSMQGDEGFGANMYWSTEPVEWSPIGAETGDSMPSIATEFLKGKPILTESPTNESRLKTDIDEEFKNEAKAADSRLKKLLPILVVILLLVGLIAALLSSFILPNLSSSGNTGKIRQVVEVPSIQASLSIRTSSMSIFK
ncbi:MAG: serine/threonine protein kinase [Ktedonobacteraceae bacterium]